MNNTKENPGSVDGHLSAILAEFKETTQLAEKWAEKWKVRAQLVHGSTWAFYSDDGKIKVVGVLVASKDNGPNILAAKVFEAAEWAIRCGVNLVLVIGNRTATILHADIVDAMGTWMPYVSDAGVVVPLARFFSKQ